MAIGGLHGMTACASFGHSDGRWRWGVHPTREGDSLDIPSQAEDEVAKASDEVRRALMSFSLAVAQWASISEPARAGNLEQLRRAGRALTTALFDGRAAEFVEELAASGFKSVNILNQFKEQVPIDFCVLRDDGGEFFLGERCLCIYRMSNRDPSLLNKALANPPVPDGPLLVGYAEDGELRSACATHRVGRRPEVEEIYAAGKIAGGIEELAVLDPLTTALTSADRDVLAAWLEDRRQVVHFNCHSEHNPDPPRLRVRAGACFGRHELAPHRADLTGTFVFLNACSSVIGQRSVRTSLAEFFREQNAGCVACASGVLDDGFATLFAHELYDELDGGRSTIFDAFLESRRRLCEREGHPMALMYTYLGPDNFALR